MKILCIFFLLFGFGFSLFADGQIGYVEVRGKGIGVCRAFGVNGFMPLIG